ncbi:MAG: hypothetical protein FJ087_18625, partial [Deltaproteobacteria bacterium]|nr:hypothetical protein [Deltaproteobacteria bacterium]
MERRAAAAILWCSTVLGLCPVVAAAVTAPADAPNAPAGANAAAVPDAQAVPGAQAVPDVPAGPSIAMVVPWGSGGAMLARRGGDESSPEGPMSFAVAPDGRFFVLDQASGRVAVFRPDGSLDARMALPATTFQDIDLAPDGRVVVLDRLVRNSLLVLGPGGETLGEHRIDGPGIPEGGAVTALMVRPDGAWLEVLHEQSVRVLGPDLAPCERAAIPGRPAHGGAADGWLAAEIAEAGAVAVVSGRPGGERVRGTVRAAGAITRIAWLEADAAGRVTVTFEVGQWDRDGGRPSSRGAV